MYKRTAKSHKRKALKAQDYMPSLQTLTERNGKGGMWAPKRKKKKKDPDAKNKLFGMRFR